MPDIYTPKIYPILTQCVDSGSDPVSDEYYVNSLLFGGYPKSTCTWKEHITHDDAVDCDSTDALITVDQKQAKCRVVYVHSQGRSGLLYGPVETGAGTSSNPFINLNSITNACATDVYSEHECDFPMIAVMVSGRLDYAVVVKTKRNMPILFDFNGAQVEYDSIDDVPPMIYAYSDCYIINMTVTWNVYVNRVTIENHVLFNKGSGIVVRLEFCDVLVRPADHPTSTGENYATMSLAVSSIDTCVFSATVRNEALLIAADTFRASEVELNHDGTQIKAYKQGAVLECDYISGSEFTIKSENEGGIYPIYSGGYIYGRRIKDCKGTMTNCSGTMLGGMYGHTLTVTAKTESGATILGEGLIEPNVVPICISSVCKSDVVITNYDIASGWGNPSITGIYGRDVVCECTVEIENVRGGVGSSWAQGGGVGWSSGIGILSDGGTVSNSTLDVTDCGFIYFSGIFTDGGSALDCTVTLTDIMEVTAGDQNNPVPFYGIQASVAVDCTVDVTGLVYSNEMVFGINGSDVSGCSVSFDGAVVPPGDYSSDRAIGIGPCDSAVDCSVSLACSCLYASGYAWDTVVIGISRGVQIGCDSTVSNPGIYIHAQGSTASECHNCTFSASSNGYAFGLQVGRTDIYVASGVTAGSVLASQCCFDGEFVPITGVSASVYKKGGFANYAKDCCA